MRKMEKINTKKLVTLALLTTIALTIFVIESAIPALVPIPGIKLGLANIVTLFVIKRYGARSASLVLVSRIILATIFTGQAVSFLYSICGGFFCLVTMTLVLKFLHNRGVVITSIFGAIAHNLGQIFVAYVILKMTGILLYIPFLMISAVITGTFTGLVVFFFDQKMPVKKL